MTNVGTDKLFPTRALFFTIALAFIGLARPLLNLRTHSLSYLLVSSWSCYMAIFLWRAWRKQEVGRSQAHAKKILIVGAGTIGRQFAASLAAKRTGDRIVVGFLDDTFPKGGDILGSVADLPFIAQSTFAEEVVIALSPATELCRIAALAGQKSRLDVKFIPDLLGFSPQALEVVCNIPLLTLHKESAPRMGRWLKRSADVVVCGASLLLAAPLLTAIAMFVKVDSPGPILYRAKRVGKKGRQFSCYKFRTMVVNADLHKPALLSLNQRDGAFFKLTDDPRITRVGRFLRRYSLDELPQLWNVLLGEMSLVGPRPHPLDDFERYESSDLRRLNVVPGMTGLWQVTARRDPSFQRNMALDLEYIERWNLALDLKILWKTIPAVLQGTGS